MSTSKDSVTEIELYNQQVNLNKLPMYTRRQLSIYNGINDAKIYLAIRGYIYDVSNNSKSYGPGKSYHKLVGKDVTRLLGLNRLKIKEGDDRSTWDTTGLNEKQLLSIEKWIQFFRKRYKIVGVIVEHER